MRRASARPVHHNPSMTPTYLLQKIFAALRLGATPSRQRPDAVATERASYSVKWLKVLLLG